MSSLQQLDGKSFDEIIYEQGKPCVVVFSRKNCHVCQEVVPELEDLKPEYEGVFDFYYVDVEENKEVFQRFSLKGVPQLLFFNDGEYQGSMAGAVEDEQIKEKISEILE